MAVATRVPGASTEDSRSQVASSESVGSQFVQVESGSENMASMSASAGGSAAHKKDRSSNPQLEDKKTEDRSRSPTSVPHSGMEE